MGVISQLMTIGVLQRPIMRPMMTTSITPAWARLRTTSVVVSMKTWSLTR